MNARLRSFSGKLFSALQFFASFPLLVQAQDRPAPDLFDTLGITAEQFIEVFPTVEKQSANSSPHSTFSGISLRPENRERLLNLLRKNFDHPNSRLQTRVLLAALLEERKDQEALDLIRKLPSRYPDLYIIEAAILARLDRADEIAAVFSSHSTFLEFDQDWLSLILMGLDPASQSSLIERLAATPGLPSHIRSKMAKNLLETARLQGKQDELIHSSSYPVLRAFWVITTEPPPAPDHILSAASSLPPEDLAFLLHSVADQAPLLGKAGEFLRAPDTGLDGRKAILRSIRDKKTAFLLWKDMPAGLIETTPLTDASGSQWADDTAEEFRTFLPPLIARHPEASPLRSLLILLSRAPEHESLLRTTAVSFIPAPEYRNPEDPASFALKMLSKRLPASEMHELMVSSKDFAALPAPARAHYFKMAGLDGPFIRAACELPFSDPAMDSLANHFAYHLSPSSEPSAIVPQEAVERVITKLEDWVYGSAEKTPDAIARCARYLGDFVVTYSNDPEKAASALKALISKGDLRSPGLGQRIIDSLPSKIRKLSGLQPAPSQSPSGTPVPSWLSGLFLFSPPDPWVLEASRSRFDSSPHHLKPPLSLLLPSRWRRSFTTIPGSTTDAATLAQLRKLFADSPQRTWMHDLQVYIGFLKSPDPAVETEARRRIEEGTDTWLEDPFASASIYLSLATRNRLTPDRENQLLTHVQRGRVHYELHTSIRNLASSRGFHESARKLTEALRNPAPEEPQPPSDYARLSRFMASGKENSEEALSLARKVLSGLAESASRKLTEEGYIAIDILIRAGTYEPFAGEIIQRMKNEHRTELEILRIEYLLAASPLVRSLKDPVPLARRIMELDPKDTLAIHEVLGDAREKQDLPRILGCLRALSAISTEDLADGFLNDPYNPSGGSQSLPVLKLFQKADSARDLSVALLSLPPPTQRPPDPEGSFRRRNTLDALARHTAEYDPDSLKALIDWTGGIETIETFTLLSMCQLLTPARRELAVGLLAEKLFTPTGTDERSDDPSLRFDKALHPLAGMNQLPLSQLATHGWLPDLANAADRFPDHPSNQGVKFAIRLLVDPTPENWRRLSTPLLANLPREIRRQAKASLRGYIQGMVPRADDLEWTLANDPDVLDDTEPYQLIPLIQLAARRNDEASLARAWTKLLPLVTSSEGSPPPDLGPGSSLLSLVDAMGACANDETWNEFIATFTDLRPMRPTADFYSNRDNLAFKPGRLSQVVKIMLPEMEANAKVGGTSMAVIFDRLASEAHPDAGLLRTLRKWIATDPSFRNSNDTTSPRAQFTDLVSGDLPAARPHLAARYAGGSSWHMDWSLAALSSSQLQEGTEALLSLPLPELGGKFDLEILGGSTRDRLRVIRKIPAAAVRGTLDLDLPPDDRFIAAAIRSTDGKVVKLSAIAPLDRTIFQWIDLPSTGNPPPPPLPSGPTSTVRLSPARTVELASLPWGGTSKPVISGWLQYDSSVRLKLEISCHGADGTVLSKEDLSTSDRPFINRHLWTGLRGSMHSELPPGTERLTLTASIQPGSQLADPVVVSLSGLRISMAGKETLPPAFKAIARIPGTIGWSTADPSSERIILFSQKLGIGVFDPAAGRFDGWISPPSPEILMNCTWLAVGNDRVFSASYNGEIFLTDLTKRTHRPLLKVGHEHWAGRTAATPAVSRDGRFLAWGGSSSGFHLADVSDPENTLRREFPSGWIYSLRFSADGTKLEAHSDRTTFTLPLSNWREAAPETAPRESNLDPLFSRLDSNGQFLEARKAGLLIHISSGTPEAAHHPSTPIPGLFVIEEEPRSVLFPPGHLRETKNGIIYFFSRSGTVYRVETAELEVREKPGDR